MRTDRELTALFAGAIIEDRPDPTFLDELFELLVEEVASLRPATMRRRPIAWWSRAPRWPLLVAASIVIATLAFGVLVLQTPIIGPPRPTSTPAPTPTASPITTPPPTPPVVPSSTLVPFTSTTYGYSIKYPSNWGTRPSVATHDRTIYPTDTDASVDYFSASAPTANDPGLIVAGPSVPRGTTLAAWTAAVEQLQAGAGFTCPPPQVSEPLQIGGEPAQLLTWTTCPSWLLWAAVVHGNRAYHLIWIDQNATNNPALQTTDKALFLRILASVTFGPALGSPAPS
jgi:hypothetical protein